MTRRQQILATAGDLFQRRGYHATSMRDIARSVRLQGSSLYAHVRSKEDLLRVLVEEAGDAFQAAADGVDPGLEPAGRLRALVRAHLAVILEHLPHATVFFHDWSHLGPATRRAVIQRRDAYQALFRTVIEEGVSDGTFTVDDVELATLFVLSAMNWSYQWLDPDGRLELDDLSERYAAMLLRSLGARVDGATADTG